MCIRDRVGTVSGTSISFGSDVAFHNQTVDATQATFDSSNNKVVISFQDQNDNHGKVVVGTISGTSISYGSVVEFKGDTTYDTWVGFDSNVNKIIVAFTDQSNSFYGTVIVGTVSGTSVSFGSATVFESAASYYPTVVFDSCLLYTSPSPRDGLLSRMPSSA